MIAVSEVCSRACGVLFAGLLACDAPAPAKPATPATPAATAETPAESLVAVDVRRVCEIAGGVEGGTPEQRSVQWSSTVVREMKSKDMIGVMEALATVAPEHKWTLIQAGVAELGYKDWSCPPLQKILEAAVPAPKPAAEPLRFALGERRFDGVVALVTRYNDNRRIVIMSKPTTCDELLAVPERPKKGRATLTVTLPWKTGTHAVESAEFIDDDTYKLTKIEAKDGTADLKVEGDASLTLKLTGAAGSANGTIALTVCE